MRAKTIIVAFAIALAVSGTCTYVLSRRMAGRTEPHVVEVRYVGAARALAAGETLKLESVTMVSWPVTDSIAGAYGKRDDLTGRTLLYPVEKGQPITQKMVSSPGAGAGLAGRIPEGMRAVALRSDEVMGVAGFLLPGSRVDVLTTYRTDTSPEPKTITVLQNAEVLAAGHQVQPDPEGKPATVTVVTLLLSADDAQKAVLASTQGTMHFIMRSGSDQKVVRTRPVALTELAQASDEGESKQRMRTEGGRPKVPSTTAVYVVETYLADKRTAQTFGAGRQ